MSARLQSTFRAVPRHAAPETPAETAAYSRIPHFP
jgi:hypothetical protein